MAKKGFLDGYKKYDASEGYGNAAQWKGAFKARMSKDEAKEILESQQQTPWTVLGIVEQSSKEVIKSAFRRLMKEWHPDRNQHRLAEAEAKSKMIIAAYEVLTD